MTSRRVCMGTALKNPHSTSSRWLFTELVANLVAEAASPAGADRQDFRKLRESKLVGVRVGSLPRPNRWLAPNGTQFRFPRLFLRVFSRPSRAPTAAKVSELPAKSAKNANETMCLQYLCQSFDAVIL